MGQMFRLSLATITLIYSILCWAAGAFALGNNQLYTGDPSTVAPGKTQFQLSTDTSRPKQTRLGGIAFRHGLTGSTELKIAYSYLWNFNGPDVQIGPNAGIKWRFLGDGRRKPSLAVSALYVINHSVGGRSRKNDYAATLIGSYPTRHAELLANYGRVWVGDERAPDLRYLSLAVVRPVGKRTIGALEYSSFTRIGSGGPRPLGRQWAVGLVYAGKSNWSYAAQVGYLMDNPRFKWHTSLGVATYF